MDAHDSPLAFSAFPTEPSLVNHLSHEDAVQFIERMYSMAILDREGRYIYLNPGWCANLKPLMGPDGQLHEVPPEYCLGKKVWDIVPESKAGYVLEHGVPLIGEYISVNNTFTSYIPRYAADGTLNGCYIYTILGNIEDARLMNRRLADLVQEMDYFRQELAQERGAKYNLNSIVGRSPAISKVKNQIRLAARVPSAVLIEGETGTGKELIAHAIHAASMRETANFVRVNCSAIPPELMESEFFGYAPGAFTGASRKGKLGRFRMADGGSLFLDEVNLLPSTMQPKFLRALQEHEVDPVGGEESVPVDVRIIAASNIPLGRLVDEKKFREDLYFRLNVINIVAPPLRERKEDIPLLVEVLIQRLNDQLGMAVQGADSRALELFQHYDWPGNIRELQNTLERAMTMTTSSILTLPDFRHLQQRMDPPLSSRRLQSSDEPPDMRQERAALEKNMMLAALAANDGNRTQAARALGISRAVFYRKMRLYGIAQPPETAN